MKNLLALLLALLLVFTICGCGANRYKAEYDVKELYKNAKDSYRAGQKVTLYFDLIATDTNYSFYVNDENIRGTYDEKKGYVLTFIMPEEDIYVSCETRNSMAYIEG